MDDALLVISTFPEAETAKRIATSLVTEKLAACANILPRVESIYRWQGKVEASAEVMAFFKTTPECLPVFQEKLRALHPYEVPEIIAVPLSAGLPDYLRWIGESCSAPPPSA